MCFHKTKLTCSALECDEVRAGAFFSYVLGVYM